MMTAAILTVKCVCNTYYPFVGFCLFAMARAERDGERLGPMTKCNSMVNSSLWILTVSVYLHYTSANWVENTEKDHCVCAVCAAVWVWLVFGVSKIFNHLHSRIMTNDMGTCFDRYLIAKPIAHNKYSNDVQQIGSFRASTHRHKHTPHTILYVNAAPAIQLTCATKKQRGKSTDGKCFASFFLLLFFLFRFRVVSCIF